MKTIHVADHFCGAGGTSTGVAEACEELGLKVDLLAINHWPVAIDTKAHPWARHLCASLTHVKPRNVVPGGRLHLLVASPECTNHSIAKGGRPRDEQSRATAWDVLLQLALAVVAVVADDRLHGRRSDVVVRRQQGKIADVLHVKDSAIFCLSDFR